jgi:hypothetical protein
LVSLSLAFSRSKTCLTCLNLVVSISNCFYNFFDRLCRSQWLWKVINSPSPYLTEENIVFRSVAQRERDRQREPFPYLQN